jgi:uncharacterized membrane protein YhiD involved in acid resistance
MRPNFEEMTSAELRAYALANRDDVEPLRILYSRRSPDSEATWYGPMCTPEGGPIEENIRIAEEAIRQRAERDREALLRSADREKQREKELQKERELEARLRQKIEQEVEARLRREIQQERVGSGKNNMATVTQEEIQQFREQLRDYPEALDALDLIEENEGDLEIAANLLAQEAGVVIVRSKPSILDDLAQKLRDVICDEVFINDLMGGALTAGVGYLTASGQIPTALATALVIYLAKIGVRKFCQSDDGKPKTP